MQNNTKRRRLVAGGYVPKKLATILQLRAERAAARAQRHQQWRSAGAAVGRFFGELDAKREVRRG